MWELGARSLLFPCFGLMSEAPGSEKKYRGQNSFVPFVPFFILVKGNARMQGVPSQTPDPNRHEKPGRHSTTPLLNRKSFSLTQMKHPFQNKSFDPWTKIFWSKAGSKGRTSLAAGHGIHGFVPSVTCDSSVRLAWVEICRNPNDF